MNRIGVILMIIFITSECTNGQEKKCNRSVLYNLRKVRAKLDSVICIPNAYNITGIYDEYDLNNDGSIDKVVCWQKKKLSDGDTVYYSIYLRGKGDGLELYKTLGNLEPLYFKSYESFTGNQFFDSIKSIYTYPTLSSVDFNPDTITIEFYIEAAVLKKLFFTYSHKEKTWVLTREMQWLVPPKNYQGGEKLDENGRKLEYDRAVKIPSQIEDFDMLKYIGQ